MAFPTLKDDSSVLEIDGAKGTIRIENGTSSIVLVADAEIAADARGRAAATALIKVLQDLVDAGDVEPGPAQEPKSTRNPFAS